MEIRPGLRREPPADLSAVGEDPALAERLRDEIRRDGPMTFARFMTAALYDPEGGYYRSAEARPGRTGDFITAPEIHPIFGATIADLVLEAWHRLGDPAGITVREYGAGTGALALAMLAALRGSALHDRLRYQPIEVTDERLTAFDDRLTEAGFDASIERGAVSGHADAAGLEPIEGVIIANEVLDALPVHRVRCRGATMVEIAVGLASDGSFTDVEVEPSTPALAERLDDEGIELADGQTAEICLALDDWIADATTGLRRGLLLLIDYGWVAADLYDPVRRRDGTLRAYVRHQVHDDLYRHIGRQDLTAHVDVTAIERAAAAAGLETVGITTQAEALIGSGIESRLRRIQEDPSTTMEEYLLVRSSLMRLLDPAAMGRFRFMIFGRGWPAGPPLSAFAGRLPEPPVTAPH